MSLDSCTTEHEAEDAQIKIIAEQLRWLDRIHQPTSVKPLVQKPRGVLHFLKGMKFIRSLAESCDKRLMGPNS